MATRTWIQYDVQPDTTYKRAIPIDEIHRVEIHEFNTSSYEVRMYQSGEFDDYEVYDVGADNSDRTFSTLALAQSAVAVILAL